MIRPCGAPRRATRGLLPVVALIAAALASLPAHASSIDQCRSQLQALHEAIPNGVTGVWAETVQEEVAMIDAINDAEGLNAELEARQAEYEAYQADPDPDGDGYALDPKIVDAKAVLSVCLYTARASELTASADDGEETDAVESADSAAEEEDLQSPPKPDGRPGDWFANAEYPVTALREERSGSVRYEVTVAADGSVAGCQASGPPGSSDLELATCDVFLTHGRFTPATDSGGHPIIGEYVGTMRWSLP